MLSKIGGQREANNPRKPQLRGELLYAKWRPWFQLYQVQGMRLCIWFFIKNSVLVLLKSELLERYRWLDCYVPGRLHVSSRVPESSKYMGFLASLAMIAHRRIFNGVGVDFNLFCLELAHSHHENLKLMLFGASSRGGGGGTNMARSKSSVVEHRMLSDYFRNPLSGSRLIRRQTQAPEVHRLFAKLHLLAITIFVTGVSLVMPPVMWMLGSMILTRRGFELSRADCVRYIVGNSNKSSPNENTFVFKYIYRPDPSKQIGDIYPPYSAPLIHPYVNLNPFNLYHLTQELSDFLEDFLFWIGWSLVHLIHLYMVLALCIKSIIYARKLRLQLMKLIDFKLRPASLLQGRNLVPVRPVLMEVSWSQREITSIQASILDYFDTIAYFNSYIARSLLLYIIILLLFSVIIMIRILRVDKLQAVSQIDHGAQAESFFIFCCTFVPIMFMLAASSIVNSSSRLLHEKMTVAMALDPNIEGTKLRWIVLLKYFKPKRLNCFVILGNTDLSWLFYLKLISWVMSAVVILKSI